MTTEMLLDYLAVRVDGERASAACASSSRLRVTDRDEMHAVGIRDGALHHVPGRAAADARRRSRWRTTRCARSPSERSPLAALEAAGEVAGRGRRGRRSRSCSALLDTFSFWFAIVEP